MVLEVRPSNHAAVHLYTSLGFELVDIKKNYYKDKDGCEDAMFFKKSFTLSRIYKLVLPY